MSIRNAEPFATDFVQENLSIAAAVTSEEPFWSRLFRKLVADAQMQAARYVWERVVSEAGEDASYAPSAAALGAALELSLRIPSAWTDSTRGGRERSSVVRPSG
jgi:hypothetical protein